MKLIASLVGFALLAACGSDDGVHRRDAAFFDAPQVVGDVIPDAPADNVSIAITNGGLVGSGLTVYFQNADSTLVKEATTDAAGSASAAMAAGGFVTALVPNPHVSVAAAAGFQDVTLDTVAGVQPGDHLVIDIAATTEVQGVNVTARSIASPVALGYTLFTTCDPGADLGDIGTALTTGAGNVGGQAFVSSACTSWDAAVYAKAGGPTAVPSIAAGAGIAVSNSVDMTAIAYATAATVAVSDTDVPAGIDGVTSNRVLVAPHGQLASPAATLAISGGGATGTLYEPAAITATGALTFTHAEFGGATYGGQQVIESGAASATYALDVGANLVHEYTSPPAYTAAMHTVTWTEDTTGVAADLHIVAINVARTPNAWTWRLVAAHDATTLTLPALPTDLFDYNPGASDSVSVGQLDSVKVPGGYDAVRAKLFATPDPTALLGAAGKVTYELLDHSTAPSFRRASKQR